MAPTSGRPWHGDSLERLRLICSGFSPLFQRLVVLFGVVPLVDSWTWFDLFTSTKSKLSTQANLDSQRGVRPCWKVGVGG